VYTLSHTHTHTLSLSLSHSAPRSHNSGDAPRPGWYTPGGRGGGGGGGSPGCGGGELAEQDFQWYMLEGWTRGGDENPLNGFSSAVCHSQRISVNETGELKTQERLKREKVLY